MYPLNQWDNLNCECNNIFIPNEIKHPDILLDYSSDDSDTPVYTFGEYLISSPTPTELFVCKAIEQLLPQKNNCWYNDCYLLSNEGKDDIEKSHK
jgi:hypothetical protein